MYEKLCYKSSTSKNKKYNSKINIPKILHLHFVDRTVIYSILMKIEVAFTALD